MEDTEKLETSCIVRKGKPYTTLEELDNFYKVKQALIIRHNNSISS